MLFTIPGLKDEEDDPIVAPDVPMRDDGADRRFVKAFIHDEIPWMEVSNEVRDLMFLAVPSINITADDLLSADEEIPADGMEAVWFVNEEATVVPLTEEPVVASEVETQPMTETPCVADSAAIVGSEPMLFIGAPVTVCMLTMPEPIEVPSMGLQAEEASVEEAVPDVSEDEVVDPVKVLATPAIPVGEAEVPDLMDASLNETAQDIYVEASAEEGSVVIEPVEIPVSEATDMQAVEPEHIEEIPVADVTDIQTVSVSKAEEAIPGPAEVPVVEDMTVTMPQTEVTIDVAEEPEAEITESIHPVVFSFGTQEFQGRGWKVCFSF